jgi:hypothetical protein
MRVLKGQLMFWSRSTGNSLEPNSRSPSKFKWETVHDHFDHRIFTKLNNCSQNNPPTAAQFLNAKIITKIMLKRISLNLRIETVVLPYPTFFESVVSPADIDTGATYAPNPNCSLFSCLYSSNLHYDDRPFTCREMGKLASI